jgi:AAA15 family ATPase/GTPase
MLIEFSVQNYRSIKERATLSMIASPDDTNSSNVMRDENIDDGVLRTAVIYGPNASGKSNIVNAMQFLRNFVLTSHMIQKGQKLNYQPFKLNEESRALPSKFHIVFLRKGTRFSYALDIEQDRVINESLYSYPKGRRSLIFDRTNSKEFKFTKDKTEQGFISDRTLENVSYLSNSTRLNYKGTAEAFDWFREDFYTAGLANDPSSEDLIFELIKNPHMKKKVLKALAEADVDISDVSAKRTAIEYSKLPPGLKPLIRNFMLLSNQEEVIAYETKTIHKTKGKDGKEELVTFDMMLEESEGTKRLFVLMGPIIDALVHGKTLILDELDVRLHLLITKMLIGLFQDEEQNRSGAQLVFTTHDVNLLDLQLFRRDQIWFTEKDESTKGTLLFSLVEFSPRKEENIEKGYLAGRYGALPFIPTGKVME